MTDVTRIFNSETRSFKNVQRKYSGQIGDSVSTTLHFEYEPFDLLQADVGGDRYVPYIMFSVYDDQGNPLIYGESSTPKFDGYTFDIPWDVTSRTTSQRVEYELYFIKNTVTVDPTASLSAQVAQIASTEYLVSAVDGITLKPSIKCKSKK